MSPPDHDEHDAPEWARDDAFPMAPHGWGWVDHKKNFHACVSHDALISAIGNDREGGVNLVWLPGHPHLMLPEEMPTAADAVRASRQRRATDDMLDAWGKLRWYGVLLAGLAVYMFYQGWALCPASASAAQHFQCALLPVFTSMSMGIVLLMFLVFALIPWYQAYKELRDLSHWNHDNLAKGIPVWRFEAWLDWQKAPLTGVLLGLLVLVAVTQMFCEKSATGAPVWFALFHNWDGASAAGLVKDAYLHGEWWRLFTAPLLHGNLVHFLMNASAMWYLGKRLEVFARWPHLLLVFLFAACIGGEASTRFVQASSIGASGGLMGWLGFLLVFESLHHRLVPRSAKRRLLAGVVLTGVVGLIGYRFIDNAAHLGGLFAGMVYAIIVFPKSTSANRPNSTLPDRIAGAAALAILILSALCAMSAMLA